MTVIINGIKISGTEPTHETITSYRWTQSDPAQNGWTDKPAMVEWVRKNPEVAYCLDKDGKNAAYVYVVENNGNPYLRTKSDGIWSNNLLAQTVYK